jgi:CRISPR-associated protein Csx10
MGSVFVYPEDMFSKDELAGLAADGIGERRVDGYGRLAVNWPGLEKFSVVEPERTESTISVDLSESSKALALTMAKRLMIKELQEQLLVWSQKHTIHGKINNHQLSRLRNVIHATINAQEYELGKIENFLSDLRPTAKKQYERARIVGEGKTSGSRLKSWLEERLQKNDGIKRLGFDAESVPEVAGQKLALTDEIKREYTLRLIEALISQKMKDNQKEAQ